MIILSSFLFFLLMYFYFLIGFSQGLAAKVLGKTYPKALYFKIHMKKSACGSNSYHLDFYKRIKKVWYVLPFIFYLIWSISEHL